MKSLHDAVLDWWDGRLGGTGRALDVITAPAEALYRGITSTRNALYDGGSLQSVRLPAPVLSVGNVAIGGTGKTPVTAWLARVLRDAGRHPAVLHGGYAPDEPALHQKLNPDIAVIAGRDRVETGRAAIGAGADVLVLDDGFQHRRLERDIDIVLVAAETWGIRRRTLPRGPWREPEHALRRATHIIVTRRSVDSETAMMVAGGIRRFFPGEVAIVHLNAATWRRGDRAWDGPAAAPPAAGALLVTAIAQPASFEENARAAGATLTGRAFFPDHHDYSEADAAAILEKAGNGAIVTTAKDWVKLERLLPRERVWVLHQQVEPEAGVDAMLTAVRGLVA
ncbi:MAG TPA: tetraacyldisaccharide 4'-kinase [Longimicrobiales bacterium]